MNKDNPGEDKENEQTEIRGINNGEDNADEYSSDSNKAQNSPDDDVERVKRFMRSVVREWLELDFLKRVELAVSVIGIVVLIIYTIYTARMYGANKESAEAAKSAAETAEASLRISQRPWVTIEVQPNSDITYSESGMSMYDLITIKNYGATPAVNAREEVRIIGSGVEASIKDLCSGLEVKPSHAGDAYMRQSYFSGVPNSKSWVLIFDPVKQGNSKEHNGTFLPILVVCVAYQSSFDSNTWHHTWKAFSVMQRYPRSLNGIYVMEEGETVKKEDVILAPWTRPEGED